MTPGTSRVPFFALTIISSIFLSEQALAESPSARLRLLRAGAGRIFAVAVDPLGEIAEARRLACEPVDDSLAAALEVFLSEGPYQAVERFAEHAEAFPDDLFGAYLRFSSLVVSGAARKS